jgi:RNase P subunit RPR2
MRQVKQGKLKEKIWRGECNECGAVWEAKENELHPTYDQREGAMARSECGQCGTEMWFYPKDAGSQWGDH